MRTKLIACLMGLLLLGCLSGCANTDEQMKRNLAALDGAVEAMRESGVEAYGFVELPFNAGMTNVVRFGNDGRILVFLRVNPE